tara:strand:- start:7 stop:477 length:471 start_codon:yes stop_codon:yes gene_type:complete
MSEEISLPKNANKEEIYQALLPQVKALLSGEEDLVANLANMAAVLKEAFGFFWVGFYIVKKGELVLGPFQGPVACTRIQKGKGVCGKAWETGETQLVPDVNAFPGHIACSASSQSEIVVPVSKGNEIIAVLDIDSDQLDAFDAVDRRYLEEMVGNL